MSNSHLKLAKMKWVIQWAGIIGLAILIWWGGPILTIGGKAPLAPTANRLLMFLLVIIIWLAYHLIILTRANQTDLTLMAELALPQEDQAQAFVEEAQNEEAVQLKQKFQSALQQLKDAQSKNKFSQKHIYELPWFVIIGAPGSGKTTLLTNSGINFPVKGKAGETTIQGIGGTRNCSWLFSDEAIFIDTAGRYSTQDSHKSIDAAAWKRFLELLKRHRPQRPINGVMLTLSLADLLTWSEEELRLYGRALRHRSVELYHQLGITIPIYLLLTKCDLVAGFTEFFDDLNIDSRGQVWGFTFPADPRSPLKLAPTYLEKLLKRLEEKRLPRIENEKDLTRKGLILDFPQQMELIKSSLLEFLGETFSGSRYEPRLLLRGVYFTSATQEGTPIDRVMSRLAGAFGLDVQKMPVFSGHVKSFFISKLLDQVILPESELAGVDQGLIRRRTLRNWAINGALMGLTTALILLWATSFMHNKIALNKVNELLDQYETLQVETIKENNDPKLLLQRLNTMKAADDVYQKQPWWQGFGVYQGKKLKWGVQRIYYKLLVFDLLELVRTRLEFHLKRYLKLSGSSTSHGELYELLKVYLMLGMPEKMEPSVVHEWAKLDMEDLFKGEDRLKKEYQLHLDQLFQHPLDALPLDHKLIARARSLLNTIPMDKNIYSNLKSQMLQDSTYDFSLKDVLGVNALSIMTTSNGQNPEKLKIPGWYTIEGYRSVFGENGPQLIGKAIRENWVLASAGQRDKVNQEKLSSKLKELYLADYESHWLGLLGNLKIKSAANLAQAIHIADSLSGPETPLKPLLMAFCKHTALIFHMNQNGGSSSEVNSNWMQMATEDDDIILEQNTPLARQFVELKNIVQSTDSDGSTLNQILLQLAKLRDTMLRGNPEYITDIMEQSKQKFKRLPDPLKDWLLPLTNTDIIKA